MAWWCEKQMTFSSLGNERNLFFTCLITITFTLQGVYFLLLFTFYPFLIFIQEYFRHPIIYSANLSILIFIMKVNAGIFEKHFFIWQNLLFSYNYSFLLLFRHSMICNKCNFMHFECAKFLLKSETWRKISFKKLLIIIDKVSDMFKSCNEIHPK